MLPKSRNKCEEKKIAKFENSVSFAFLFLSFFLFFTEREILMRFRHQKISRVFFLNRDHYNSWEVFNELIAFFVFQSVARPFPPSLALTKSSCGCAKKESKLKEM